MPPGFWLACMYWAATSFVPSAEEATDCHISAGAVVFVQVCEKAGAAKAARVAAAERIAVKRFFKLSPPNMGTSLEACGELNNRARAVREVRNRTVAVRGKRPRGYEGED